MPEITRRAGMSATESLHAHARYVRRSLPAMTPQEAARYGARIVRLSDAARGLPPDNRLSMPQPVRRAIARR